jgi:hypothetical protein
MSIALIIIWFGIIIALTLVITGGVNICRKELTFETQDLKVILSGMLFLVVSIIVAMFIDCIV